VRESSFPEDAAAYVLLHPVDQRLLRVDSRRAVAGWLDACKSSFAQASDRIPRTLALLGEQACRWGASMAPWMCRVVVEVIPPAQRDCRWMRSNTGSSDSLRHPRLFRRISRSVTRREGFRSTEIEALGEVHAAMLERGQRGGVFDALGDCLLVE
jgi:hypothetical protein